MSRVHILAVIAAGIAVTAFSMSSCARDADQTAAVPAAVAPAPVASVEPAVVAETPPPAAAPAPADLEADAPSQSQQPQRLAAGPTPASAIGQWQAGTNYTALSPPQPTSAPTGKVEVAEIFWYGCSHCFALDPALESWNANKPAYIEFVRIPVMWGPSHKQHAKLFYTLQALGRMDLHTKVFETIHQGGAFLAAQSEAEGRAQQLAFARQNGISEKDFNNAYDSMSVALNMQRASDATRRYRVEGVPLLIVNGRYSTDISQAGSPAKLISLITDLAASEKRR